MIHYSCDRCRKVIDPNEEVRYVVNVEAHATMEPFVFDEIEDDRDYLAEIQGILEQLDDTDAGSGSSNFQRRTYDLCPDCYRKFMQNPVGLESPAHIGFSPN
jgi:hypothetical protein